MLSIKKKIVSDETMRPVAVMVDYDDWKKIEQYLKEKEELNARHFLEQYAGVIHLTEDPLDYQKRVRREW